MSRVMPPVYSVECIIYLLPCELVGFARVRQCGFGLTCLVYPLLNFLHADRIALYTNSKDRRFTCLAVNKWNRYSGIVNHPTTDLAFHSLTTSGQNSFASPQSVAE